LLIPFQRLGVWAVPFTDALTRIYRVMRPELSPAMWTTLACWHTSREIYVFQSTMDTRPEDLVITPVLTEARRGPPLGMDAPLPRFA
jgi:hypothetical protein